VYVRRDEEEVVDDEAVDDASSPAGVLLPALLLPTLDVCEVLLIELNLGPTDSPQLPPLFGFPTNPPIPIPGP